jgi:hypothetical protein
MVRVRDDAIDQTESTIVALTGEKLNLDVGFR